MTTATSATIVDQLRLLGTYKGNQYWVLLLTNRADSTQHNMQFCPAVLTEWVNYFHSKKILAVWDFNPGPLAWQNVPFLQIPPPLNLGQSWLFKIASWGLNICLAKAKLEFFVKNLISKSLSRVCPSRRFEILNKLSLKSLSSSLPPPWKILVKQKTKKVARC